MGRTSKIAKEILDASEGLLGNLTDITLYFIFFGLEFGTTLGSKQQATNKGLRFANETLEKINYRSIKRTIYDLKRKGLIKYAKREIITASQITAEGFLRLKSLIPVYNDKRTWDGRLYLINYDIPSKPLGKRDLFREFLKKLNCGFMQQSLWVTCYNPKMLVEKFIEENRIPGQVLISDLGPDGSIGQKDIKTLLEEIFNLSSLNYQYEDFIKRFKRSDRKNTNIQAQASFAFHSILNQDPQLPWPLLPDYWLGNEAYELWREFLFK